MKIKNLLLTFLFLLFSSYFILFTAFHHFERSNKINSIFRVPILQSKILRTVFMLNEWGDGRFEYLSSKKDTIYVEIDYQVNRQPQIDTNAVLTELMQEILGKKVVLNITQDNNIPDVKEYETKHIAEILKKSKNEKATDKQDYMHIIYLSKSIENPTNSGWVVGSDEIVIFKDAIMDLTDNYDIQKRLEESTIKHEFGHLLGVDHIDRDSCIMSENVEVLGNFKYQANNIPIDYCGETLVKIDNFKKML